MTKTMMFAALILAALARPGLADPDAHKFKTVTVKDAAARNLMEALAAAGFEMKSLEPAEQFGKLAIEAGGFSCDYNAGTFPDEWMVDVNCTQVSTGSAPTMLKNPLALAKALAATPARFQPHTGARTITVESVSCLLDRSTTKKYTCKLAIPVGE